MIRAIKPKNMETIIGLLFILLPVIFRLIGKKLDQAGNQEKARQVREIAEALAGEEDKTLRDWYFGKEEPEEPVHSVELHLVEKQAVPPVEGIKTVARKPILLEEKEVRKMEHVDPKKLVIYSEIMKPKFNE
jgi:hypothetical protein